MEKNQDSQQHLDRTTAIGIYDCTSSTINHIKGELHPTLWYCIGRERGLVPVLGGENGAIADEYHIIRTAVCVQNSSRGPAVVRYPLVRGSSLVR